jgi:hypothetical protein
LIAGIAGFVLLIDLWFDWYGVKVTAGSGLLKGFSIGASANAWESFSLIDIILFLVALVAIGAAALRALDNLPELPWPAATIVTVAGGIAVLLILFRIIDTPVDTHGVSGIDVSRKLGIWLGLLSAGAITYGGWRAMQESGASFGDLGGGRSATPGGAPAAGGRGAGGGSAGGGAPSSSTAPTTPMPAVDSPDTGTDAARDEGDTPPPPAASADPVPGGTAGETPAELAGEPPAETRTQPPGI